MDAAKKFNRRMRSAKWMADYQKRAADTRRAFRAAEMQMKLNNWRTTMLRKKYRPMEIDLRRAQITVRLTYPKPDGSKHVNLSVYAQRTEALAY